MSKYEDLDSCRSLDCVWGERSLNGELAESFMGHSSSLSSYLAREGIHTRSLGSPQWGHFGGLVQIKT